MFFCVLSHSSTRSVVRSIEVITQEVVTLKERMDMVKQDIEQVEKVTTPETSEIGIG